MPRGPMKSNQAKALAGTLKPHRTRITNVIKGAPDCPAHLSDHARREWSRIVSTLDKLGTLSTADYSALELYAVTHERWTKALAVINERGMTFVSGNGYEQVRPEVAVAQKAEQQLINLLKQLGLTPASREKVSAVPDDTTKQNDDGELLELR